MISLLKSEKADANVLFIKIEIEHWIKMSQTKMQKRFSNVALHMLHINYKRRLLH